MRVRLGLASLCVLPWAAALFGCGDDDAASVGDSGSDARRADDAGTAMDAGAVDASTLDSMLPDDDATLAPDMSAPADAGPLRNVTFAPTDEVFPGPERGFYRYVDIASDRDLSFVREGGDTLVYSYVHLDAYRDEDTIDASLLDDVAAGLDAARAAGVKVVLRFAYNEGPYPDPEPDAPLDRVLAHIAQVTPMLRANEDVIAIVQAGFVGAWGEWHSSTNGLDDDPDARRAILEALLDALPPSRSTQMRYPPYKEAIFGGALTEGEAWLDTDEARMGHHNDCFVSSDTDVGTYPDDDVERWMSYVAADTTFVPMGGETCDVFPERSGCEGSVSEMERMHVSFINRDYHPDVVDGWGSGGCLDEMERRLGYRIVLIDAEVPAAIAAGSTSPLFVRVRLRNDGWAAPFNPRVPHLVIDGPSGTTDIALDADDVRRWLPGREITLTASITPSSPLVVGEHQIALWLPDASARLRDRAEYAIRAANEGTWDEARGWNVLTTVSVVAP